DGIRDPLVTGVQTCALPICFNYTGWGDIPNAAGGTCPDMAFKVAYNQFSGATGYNGRRGAAKVVIFETDGVPNHHCGGTFQNNRSEERRVGKEGRYRREE